MNKIKILIILLSLMTTEVFANTTFAADGFISVSGSSYKMASNGVFVYCDKPDAYKNKCSDLLIRGAGNIQGEERLSKWRTADEYLKYKLSDDFSYAGIGTAT